MAVHSIPKILLIAATVIVFALVTAFNALGATRNGAGVFQNNTGAIANAFYLEVTPAGWTFSIWGFIYAWQAAWLLYAVVTIFRRKVGTYVYLMSVFPCQLFIFYILNNLANVGWLFAWDRMKLYVALPLIALTPITLYVSLAYSFGRLYANLDFLTRNALYVDIWLIRMLIQNGMAFYAAWVTVATYINVGLVMTYKDGSDINDTAVSQDISSTVVLVLVLVSISTWMALDLTVLDKYTRYTFSPYVTWTVAMAGVVQKNFNLDTAYRNSLFSAALLGVAATLLVCKIPYMMWRHFKHPIHPLTNDYKPTI
ncbi:uncharacterized protein LOC127860744 isoform X2 [Dreissena polymorpha]|nr:uncharacterized protein LOC127860744 isoform X2 [Dreissena polymorpha]